MYVKKLRVNEYIKYYTANNACNSKHEAEKWPLLQETWSATSGQWKVGQRLGRSWRRCVDRLTWNHCLGSDASIDLKSIKMVSRLGLYCLKQDTTLAGAKHLNDNSAVGGGGGGEARNLLTSKKKWLADTSLETKAKTVLINHDTLNEMARITRNLTV